MKHMAGKIAFSVLALVGVLAGALYISPSAQATATASARGSGLAGSFAPASIAVPQAVSQLRPGAASAAVSDKPIWPACSKPGPAVPVPSDFPQSFPLPPGSVVTSSQQMTGGWAITAMTPWDVQTVAAFLAHDLPTAGFMNGRGDAENNEAESIFAGQGYMGRWKARSLANCPAAVTLTVFAGR